MALIIVFPAYVLYLLILWHKINFQLSLFQVKLLGRTWPFWWFPITNPNSSAHSAHRAAHVLALEMSNSKPLDNPYLAHLPPSQRGVASQARPGQKEPLYGWVPRMVKAADVRKALVCFMNIFWVFINKNARTVMLIHLRINHTPGNTRRFSRPEKNFPFLDKWMNSWR